MPAGSSPVVDSDGHILEPADLWERYLDDDYRDRAIRIVMDDDGRQHLLFDGMDSHQFLAAFGGVTADADRKADLMNPEKKLTYEDGFAPGSNDPKERLEVMDQDGIDISILYPTIGIFWEGWIKDPKLATAYTKAYNRWLADFCSENPQRLKGAAHISLLDPEAACQEARRAREAGSVGVMLSPDPAARGGLMLNDPELGPFWETLQDLDMPMAWHVVVRPNSETVMYKGGWAGRNGLLNYPVIGSDAELALMNMAVISLDVEMAFSEMMSVGLFEQYPRLRCGVLEAGATWIGAKLDRMDNKFEHMLSRVVPLKMKPSEYFYRQCVVSADPDETMIAACVEHIGADYFVWASDYPHIDAGMGVLAELKRNIKSLSIEDQDKVLGASAIKFYDL
jgi:predicted TIM-barrel fold metal-dependent hydrolase